MPKLSPVKKSEVLWEHGDVQIVLIQRRNSQCRVFWTTLGDEKPTSKTLGTTTEIYWDKALAWGQEIKNAFIKAQGGG